MSSLKNENEIKKSIDWDLKKRITPNLIFICPGFIFNDNEEVKVDEYIDSIFINSILPMFIFRAFVKKKNIKIVTLGSIFSTVPMKNKLFYSYSKKYLHYFLIIFLLIKQEIIIYLNWDQFIPLCTKALVDSYVSFPSDISKQIVRIIESKKGGVYYLPKFWVPLLPFYICL